jgi:hypothetical protein
MLKRLAVSVIASVSSSLLGVTVFSGCSSGPRPQTETLAYANLNNERYYEKTDLPSAWKAIQLVFKNYKLTSEKGEDASERTLETDWFVSQANERYQTIMIDQVPHQRPLESRLRFNVVAKALFGGTQVTVKTSEEIETIHDDGLHAGFSQVSTPDPARAATILDNIGRAILATSPAQPAG